MAGFMGFLVGPLLRDGAAQAPHMFNKYTCFNEKRFACGPLNVLHFLLEIGGVVCDPPASSLLRLSHFIIQCVRE